MRRLASLAPLTLGSDDAAPELRRVDVPILDSVLPSFNPETATAAFGAYLGRIQAQTRFDIGYSDAGLKESVAGKQAVFASVVPLRFDIDETQTFASLAEKTAVELTRLQKARTWVRDLPLRYPELRNKPELHKPLSFSAGIAFGGEATLPGRDLTLLVREGACALAFNTRVFDNAAISSTIGQFATLLASALTQGEQPVSDLPLLDEAERRKLLIEWNNTVVDFDDRTCVHEFFERQALRRPNAVAIVFEDKQLTYAELNERANRLAAYLRTQGVGPEVTVGLSVERSLEMMVGLLAPMQRSGWSLRRSGCATGSHRKRSGASAWTATGLSPRRCHRSISARALRRLISST
jgi:non-ribosomal peptide synthetase component F